MTKEELIELSDLNREDNVKYISSEAQGIAIALNSDIYAPTLCKLERAYICGRRKSENRIAKLEKENAELKAVLYCSRETCDNCGFIDCENFQRQRKSVPCSQYISYKDRLKRLDKEFNVIANEYGKAESKLTKAKEFLNEFMRISKAIDEDFDPDYSELIGETDQFLKEVEK